MCILVQLPARAEAARAERRAHRKVVKKTSSVREWPPSFKPLSPACVTIQPWTPLSSSAAPRGLPASLAPSSASSVVSLSSCASMMSGASAASSAARTLGLECGSCLSRQGRRARMAKQRPPAAVTPAASPAAGSATAAAALPAASAILSNFGPARPAPAARPLHICLRPLPSRLHQLWPLA